jgi:polyisoprenoid-binding protein YceI
MLRALALVLAIVPAVATAEALQAGPTDGRLGFVATQAGAKFAGEFRRFQVTLDLDRGRPDNGRLDVTVEVASVDTQDAERDEILRGPEFFQADEHPRAAFHAGRFERAGEGWRARGELTIRGVTQAIPVEFTLAAVAGDQVMTGNARLSRLAFGIGRGEWADTEWVGDEVEVRFELRLRPTG